jgi:hypothetical protein
MVKVIDKKIELLRSLDAMKKANVITAKTLKNMNIDVSGSVRISELNKIEKKMQTIREKHQAHEASLSPLQKQERQARKQKGKKQPTKKEEANEKLEEVLDKLDDPNRPVIFVDVKYMKVWVTDFIVSVNGEQVMDHEVNYNQMYYGKKRVMTAEVQQQLNITKENKKRYIAPREGSELDIDELRTKRVGEFQCLCSKEIDEFIGYLSEKPDYVYYPICTIAKNIISMICNL